MRGQTFNVLARCLRLFTAREEIPRALSDDVLFLES
jgi:hypothetical protein